MELMTAKIARFAPRQIATVASAVSGEGRRLCAVGERRSGDRSAYQEGGDQLGCSDGALPPSSARVTRTADEVHAGGDRACTSTATERHRHNNKEIVRSLLVAQGLDRKNAGSTTRGQIAGGQRNNAERADDRHVGEWVGCDRIEKKTR